MNTRAGFFLTGVNHSMRTNKTLLLSLTGNLLLIGLAGYLIESRPVADIQKPISSRALPVNLPRSLQWSDLESDDYPTYIARLRSVGCPEATIHELISGELQTTFTEKRLVIESRLTGNSAALSSAVRELEQEQSRLLVRLLPSVPAELPIEPASSAGDAQLPQLDPIAPRRHSPAPTVRMPLAFESIELQSPSKSAIRKPIPAAPGARALNQIQQETVERLREGFLQEIGEAQDPADPKYLDRWVKAQPVLDERLRAELGTDLFNQYQIDTFRPE
ncbi:MAG: hypothetical protein JWL59_2203 [Chthoniobacteraceae bacterium]|nr:hypothetical protein [Chthoniobacteraceae bacterium]